MKVRRGAKKVRQQAKKKNEFRFKKTKTMHTVVQQHWDGEASVKHNLQQLGVADDPNRAVAPATPVASAAAATAKDPEAIFALPPVDKRDRNPRRRIMSQEDQAYIAKLLAEHGQDFKVRMEWVGMRPACACVVAALPPFVFESGRPLRVVLVLLSVEPEETV